MMNRPGCVTTSLLLSAILCAEGSAVVLEVAGLPMRSNWFAVDWDPLDVLQSGGYGFVMIASGAALTLSSLYRAARWVRHVAWLWALLAFFGLMLYANTRMIWDGPHPWTLFVLQTLVFCYLLWHYLVCVAWDDTERP